MDVILSSHLVAFIFIVLLSLGKADNPCSLPPNHGPCGDSLTRYYYNSNTATCTEFTYGGCEGNGNNFRNAQQCRQFCGSFDVCSSDLEIGDCGDYLDRYYYNSKNKKCEHFGYTGCNGNDNNFGTLESCESACIDKTDNENIINGFTGHNKLYNNDHRMKYLFKGYLFGVITTALIFIVGGIVFRIKTKQKDDPYLSDDTDDDEV
eukprot:386123_1